MSGFLEGTATPFRIRRQYSAVSTLIVLRLADVSGSMDRLSVVSNV